MMGRACRACGCTDADCRQCIEAQGGPCFWVEADLCSRCALEALLLEQLPPDLAGQALKFWEPAKAAAHV